MRRVAQSGTTLIVCFAYTERTAVFCGSNRYTTTIKIAYHNGE